MKKRKLIAIASVISMVGSILVFMGNGCSGQFQVNDTSLSSLGATSNTGAGGANTPALDVIPGTKTVSVVYSQQALDQLSACAGVATPSASTQKVYEANKGALSVYGSAETITSPMMMAVISISGELCNDLIGQEKSAQRMFKNWGLNGNTLPATGDLNAAVTRMALSCWQRPETSQERQYILDAVYSVKDGDPMGAQTAALILCTSMLSSLNSLLN